MAALRERYPARDGVGHANRPRLHDALGLDAQSRRLCLSFARRWESDANPNRITECYSDSNCYCYCTRLQQLLQQLRQQHTDTQTYAHPEDHSDAEAASYAAAAAIARN